MSQGRYRDPDFGRGRDYPNNDISQALSRNARQQAKSDSLARPDTTVRWQSENAPFLTLQDFIRPGKSLVNPNVGGYRDGQPYRP